MIVFPAASTGGGTCVTPGPMDVKKTPAPPAPFAPIPYPNMAQISNSSGACSKVKIMNKDTVVENTTASRSSLGEPGTLKGMIVPKGEDKAKYLKGSSKVTAQGKKMVPHLTPTGHDGNNLAAGGMHAAPSQTKVFVAV